MYLNVINYTVENNQLSKNSQTGPTSHVSSESRHQWQVHTPVSDILDSENIKYEFHNEIKEEVKGKEGQDSQEEAGDRLGTPLAVDNFFFLIN